MFPKFLSAEQVKAAEDKAKAEKKKRKALKKEVRRLSSDSVITKLREDLELSNQRAFHFEREFFNLQKSHETLTDCYQTINEADQQLKADYYDLTKENQQKDAEIKIYCDQIQNYCNKSKH